MGQVWLAEQTAPVRRPVALKLIKAGMYDETMVRRFQAERQSLAIMDHPAIAKVFDAGITPQGQPYFVMEYVPGLTITEYCDQKKLKIRERLVLFIQACDGVQHAHQKAIIHRDLKPANILVIEVDGKPVPRIIDFGLAKAATAPQADATLYTRFGQFMGTPGYMSPEQVDANSRDIDTRTDVYSLGVILYELLTGMQPFEMKGRQRPSLEEWLRRLREEEPRRPSSKLSADRESSTEAAAARGTETKQLVSALRGDLDWITMKALERDRERRYGAPAALAADLHRYLNHEPVTARPASAAYQMGKFIRRHRLEVGVVAGLLLLLTGVSVLQGLQVRKITHERDRATRITDFMTSMFRVSDPSEARGNSITAREILDKASTDIDKGLAQDPEVQSQMQQVMANTYVNLGLYTRARDLTQRALERRLRLLGADDPKTLESSALLGWILEQEGHDTDAERLERRVLADARRILGLEDPLTLETMDHLGVILQHEGNYDEEAKLEREVVRIGTRRFGPQSALTLQAMNHLGGALGSQARFTEAEQTYRQLLDVERRVWGLDHPETLKAMNNLAMTLYAQERYGEAEPLYRETLAAQQRVLGPEHHNTTLTMEHLAFVLMAEGHVPESEVLHRSTLDIRLRTLGPDHPDTLRAAHNVEEVVFKEGHLQEAEQLQRETLQTQLRILGPENPDTLQSESILASILIDEGDSAEAETIARRAFDVRVHNLGPQHTDTLETLAQLGKAMAHDGHYPEASKLYHDILDKQDNTGQGNVWYAWYGFASVAAAGSRFSEAVQYLREAINHGYKDADGMMADDDLKSLRTNESFQELVAALKRGAKSPAQSSRFGSPTSVPVAEQQRAQP
jgi:serine/threonine protein kinase